MIWDIYADNYTAALRIEGVDDLRVKHDNYGVEGSEFLTHNGHEVLKITFEYAEDHEGNDLSEDEIEYNKDEIIESIATCHLKM